MRKSARSCNLYLYSLLFILSSCKGIGSPGKSLISDSNDTGSLSKSVSIETAPNGIGDQISSISLSISESLSIYAILRDEEGTFVSNTEVLWSLSGAAGSLVINQNGKSALFSALSVGTAQIKAISDEKQYVITIEVTASPNTLPVANDDGPMATAANTMISVSALLNDSDSDGDSISIVSHSASSHGSVVVNGDQLEYTPDPGFYGSDSFTYTIDDGNSGQDTATVQLIVVDNFTWIGTGGNNLWTNGSNWCGNIVNQNCSGGSAPGNLDLARFNSSCLNNCEVTINASINIFGIIMQDSFSGTIEQGSGSMMILGSDGFTQRGGSFIGSDANITLTEGLFSLIGGSFTNTSSTFKLTRTTNVNETYFTVNSVATFLHNNGTVNFIAQRPWECGNTKLTLDIPSTLDFYNVRFDGKTSGCGGGSSENVVKAGSTLVVTNDLTLGGGYLSGDLELKGNLLIPNDAPLYYGFGLSNANIIFSGTGNQTYDTSISGKSATGFSINKSSGTLTPSHPANDLTIRFLRILQGSFQAPSGILEINQNAQANSLTVLQINSGTTFDANGGTLSFYGRPSTSVSTPTLTFAIYEPTLFNNLTINHFIYGGRHFIVDLTNQNLAVGGTFTHTEGRINGGLDLYGDAVFNNTISSSGNASINFLGTANQNISQTGLTTKGAISINKAAGIITMTTNIDFTQAGQTMTMLDGDIDLNGFNLTIDSTLSMSSGTTATLNSGALSANSAVIPPGSYDSGMILP